MSENGNGSLAAKIEQNAVLVTISKSQLGVNRKVGANSVTGIAGETEDEKVDRAMMIVTKRLIDCKEYKAIEKHGRAFDNALAMRSLPSKYRRGTYVLPVTQVDWLEEEWPVFLSGRRALVGALCDRWTEIVDEARERLGPLFDPQQYPDVRYVRAAFGVSKSYESIGVPQQLEELRPDLFASEKLRLRNAMEEAARNVRETLRVMLIGLVDNLQGRLGYSEDGKKLVFKDSTVRNLTEFLDMLPIRNVTEDADLAAIGDRCRALLESTTPDLLRKDVEERDYVKGRLTALRDEALDLVEVEKRRSFDWDAMD